MRLKNIVCLIVLYVPCGVVYSSAEWKSIANSTLSTNRNQTFNIKSDSHHYTIRIIEEPIVQCTIDNTCVNVVEKTIEISENGKIIERFVLANNIARNYMRHSIFSKFAYGIVWALVFRFGLQLFFHDTTISPEAKGWISGAYGLGAALSLD